MRNLKKLAVVVAAVFASSAIGVASASANDFFTASAIGSLTGKALTTQELITAAGVTKCTAADTTGTISSTETTEQHVTVIYTGCTVKVFGGFITYTTHVTPA